MVVVANFLSLFQTLALIHFIFSIQKHAFQKSSDLVAFLFSQIDRKSKSLSDDSELPLIGITWNFSFRAILDRFIELPALSPFR
jgi:hypothetical protein